MNLIYLPSFCAIQNNQGANMGANYFCPTMYEIYQGSTLLYRWYDSGGTYQNRYLNGTTGENPNANNHPDLETAPAKDFSQIAIGTYYGKANINEGGYTVKVYNYAKINYKVIILWQTQNGGTSIIGQVEPQTVGEFNFNVTSGDLWHKLNLWQGWTLNGNFTPNPFEVNLTLEQIKTPVPVLLTEPNQTESGGGGVVLVPTVDNKGFTSYTEISASKLPKPKKSNSKLFVFVVIGIVAITLIRKNRSND
jgi:hypothetical protein